MHRSRHMSNYIVQHANVNFTPNGVVNVDNVSDHNREVEERVLAEWRMRPAVFVAYFVDGKLQTWLGTVIGGVIRGHSYRNHLTCSRMTYLRVRGTNGAEYYGTYGSDWAQAVKLRRVGSKR